MVSSLLCGLLIAAAQSPQMPNGTIHDWVNNQSKWKQVGLALMAKAPPDVKSGDELAKLNYLYRQYCDLIVQGGAPLNSTQTGRLFHGFHSWTCGGHADQLAGLFNGSGIKDLQTFLIKGNMSDPEKAAEAGVNREHGSLFAAFDNTAFAYDPWIPAFLTNKTYRNDLQMDFGGLPFPIWEMVMFHQGYDQFTASEPKGQVIPYKGTVLLALQDTNAKVEKDPKPPRPERPVQGGHWRLDRMSVVSAGDYSGKLGTDGFAAYKNQLWSWRYEDGVLIRTRLNIAMADGLSFLTPGSRNLIARITEERPANTGSPTGWYEFEWQPNDKYVQRYVGVDRLIYQQAIFQNVEKVGPYAEVLQCDIPVPSTAPNSEFRLVFSAGGKKANGGGIHYMYKWSSSGSVPDQIAKPTFAGRWQTEWGVIELSVKDRTLKGTYPHDSGRLDGKVSLDGMKVTGTWSEAPSFKPPKDAGEFEFRISEDGKRFEGEYWYGTRNPKVKGKTWNGKKIE